MGVSSKIPTVITVFGATGDLMAKKIIPSLFHLFQIGKIPNRFEVIGFARRPWSDADFQAYVVATARQYHVPFTSEDELRQFAALFMYQPGTFDATASYASLREKIMAISQRWGEKTNKLFYLAVPPEQFGIIFANLAAEGLNKSIDQDGWSRILIEKPFGADAPSAQKLEKLLTRFFTEDQLYRIDHYLAKEIIQAIIHFRFSNNLLETAWDKDTIEKIEIRLLEKIGVEERGAFYDGVGALRDVGQNHLLEMLAAVTMEDLRSLDETELRSRRAEIISALKPWSASDIKRSTYRAQYDGYQTIRGVAPDSSTETYYKLKTELTHPRWKGVPIIMEAGKRAAAACKEVVVTLKHPPTCVMCSAERHVQNKVVFTMEPEDRITIHFWTKKPGFEKLLEERVFTFFLYEKEEKRQYVEEYSKLLLASILGDQTLFVSKEEILSMWHFVDPVVKAWHKNAVPLMSYAPDSNTMVADSEIAIKNAVEAALPKEIGVVGLGKMGGNLARQLVRKGWRVVGYNRTFAHTQAMAAEGVIPAASLTQLVQALPKQKIIWLMVPSGKPVDEMLFGKNGLVHELKRGDIIIDGGNSFYKDTVARAKKLKKYGIEFFDVGTSGGPSGALNGACLMIGGDKKVFTKLESLFADVSHKGSYQFFPGVGAGHFVKMIHNGIEYGMMQAIAEGFAILGKVKFSLNLKDVAAIYNKGSVIESRLIGWLAQAFELHGEDLSGVSGVVGHTGEGAWTVEVAKELAIKAKIIEESLKFRVQSIKNPTYTGQVVAALREQFGGHSVK